MKKKILITGVAGYIGSQLTHILLESGYKVVGVDSLKFGKESIMAYLDNPDFTFYRKDIRDHSIWNNLLKDVYGIVHLAAIVGDPACKKEPLEAIEVNLVASKALYEAAEKSSSVKRFIFASTCSNYGKMNGEEFLNENSALSPVSLYAKLKVKFERHILDSAPRNDLHPTSLRFATVYGISPRTRFDLTVNEFIRDAALKKRLTIYGEQFWRPYCHVVDVARAIKLVLESEAQKVDHSVFGIGDSAENYQKKTIAEEILKLMPDTNVCYIAKDNDPRNYKVDFTKIKNELGFAITKRLPDGLAEVYELISNQKIDNPFDKKYINI